MQGSDKPLISVVMGVRYTRESTSLLERAVRSILDQTYKNLEFMICDDGSTSVALAFLDQMAQEDSRVRLLRGCDRLDLASKLNFCIAAEKGKYIARMDDDDYSEPERFVKQVTYIEANPAIAFTGSSVMLEKDGMPAGIRKLPEAPTERDFLFVQPYIHPTLMFHREALEMVGGYCEEARCVGCEDYDLLLRMYRLGLKGRNLPEVLLHYCSFKQVVMS